MTMLREAAPTAETAAPSHQSNERGADPKREPEEIGALDQLYELVRWRAAKFPDTVALGGEAGLGWRLVTGAQLLDLTDRLAVELAEQGVHEGDRVVL